ncbi:hypothetical protein KL86PLE_41281 [uncultured Pleomorphomonas sp.]|uniref:Uncharacterized protein n=1 Tax=uncultured Pleomorphomonas sp. TaxID=442121 RepID=A0A212LIU1_9HYPH|nr:hypothetical protein KL86PLE_41281 [uncultured Pleomorphomonas sp.]
MTDLSSILNREILLAISDNN